MIKIDYFITDIVEENNKIKEVIIWKSEKRELDYKKCELIQEDLPISKSKVINYINIKLKYKIIPKIFHQLYYSVKNSHKDIISILLDIHPKQTKIRHLMVPYHF